MGTKIMQAYGVGGPFINVFPPPILAQRAPATGDVGYPIGQQWVDQSGSSPIIYTNLGSGTWESGGNALATNTEAGIVYLSTYAELAAGTAPSSEYVPSANDVYTYVNSVTTAGAPVATETTAGIGELATDAEAIAGTPSTGLLALFVTPSNLTPVFASPPAIGGTLPAAGAFTGLTTDGTGVVTLASSADATISTATGSFVVSAGESATDAVKIESTAGGVQILASGASAGEDIVLTATGSSVRLTATESATDSINIESTLGGIKILASGASAGEDIVLTATGSSIRLTATESATDSINIESTLGGINILASGASAGEDINVTATGSSVNVSSTENAALAIYLHADGGASETIRLRADQGTGAASIDLLSDVGGVTITGGLATADAINIVASDAAGGIDIDCGTGGIAADTSGAVVVTSTANSAASIFLHANGGTSETIRLHADQGTGAASLDLLSDVGGITLRGGLGTADAINITATNAAGGIDIDSGTNGFLVDTTGAISLDGAAASNFTVTGAFDMSVITTLGSLNLTAGEDAADAIVISAGAGGIDILATGAATQDIDIVNTGGSVNISATENDAGAITIGTNGGASERITVTCAQGTNAASIALTSTAGGLTFTGGLGTADAINIAANTAGGGIDIDSSTGGFIVDTTGAISLDSALASNLTVTGAADLTVNTTAGSLILRAGESATDAVVLESTAGGVQILASGASAGEDILVTATGSSIKITATESVSDAIVINASGGASGVSIDAGTAGITFGTGLINSVTAVVTGVDSSPYALLGTDYFLSVDTGAGVMTITLPGAPTTGRTVVIYDGGGAAAGSNITIDGNGKNIAAGGTSAGSKLINTAYESYILTYNGTLWLGQNIA